MSKDRNIDDAELANISGAGSQKLEDAGSTDPQDGVQGERPESGGGGGGAPGGPDGQSGGTGDQEIQSN